MTDAIVVGSGASGGVAALALAEAGLQVLVLEAGPDLPASRAFGHEPLNSLRRLANVSSGRQRLAAQHPGYWKANPDLYVDEWENPYSTPDNQPFLWTRGRQVGGKSLTWGGITLRLSDAEFQAAERDGHGRSWPIRHADLAPFYERLEALLQIHGQCDGLPQLPDPTGAPLPALPLTPAERHLQHCIRRDLNLPLIPSRGFALRTRADGPWPRSCSQGGALKAALATGRVRIQSDAVVSHVTVEQGSGRASAVEWIHARSGRQQRSSAALVVLCASTIESLRLLLHSQEVGGLDEVSGLLGQGLMDHVSASCFFALPEQPAADTTELSGAGSCFIPNTVNLPGSEEDTAFQRGYGLWCGIQRFDPPALFKRQRQAAVGFLIGHGEVLGRPDNRVSLHPERRDAWGIPIAHIDCRWGENERRMVRHMEERMRAVVASGGGRIAPLADLFVLPLIEPLVMGSQAMAAGAAPPGYYIHELGGAPMAASEAEGVLNPWNQVWRTPNLLVCDGSAWPSAGWQSPTLTTMALSWRACSHAAEAMKRGEL